MKNPDEMTIEEINAEIEGLKSPFEKMLDRETRRMILEKERAKRELEHPPTLGIHVQETVKPQDIFGRH